MTTALTLGTFDCPHIGHVLLLQRMAATWDYVIVGVNSDRFVNRYKRAYPLFTQDERANLIGELTCVNEVVLNDGPGRDTIFRVAPDVLVVGSDWQSKDYYSQIDVTSAEMFVLGTTIVYLPYTRGISTSEIKARLRG